MQWNYQILNGKEEYEVPTQVCKAFNYACAGNQPCQWAANCVDICGHLYGYL